MFRQEVISPHTYLVIRVELCDLEILVELKKFQNFVGFVLHLGFISQRDRFGVLSLLLLVNFKHKTENCVYLVALLLFCPLSKRKPVK